MQIAACRLCERAGTDLQSAIRNLQSSGGAMTRVPKAEEAEWQGKEEMVQAIVGVLDRTFAAGGRPQALTRVAEMFRGLDERTLRAIAYQQGLFEDDLEPADEDRDRDTR
jgi:hypothetical protein